MKKIPETLTISIVGKEISVTFHYEEENARIGSGDGDHPGSLTIDIISLDIDAKDLVYILNSYRYTDELMQAIKTAIAGQMR